MDAALQSVVRDTPIVDVHEHHMPATLLNRDVGLLQLFDESYAGWTRVRAYALPGETIPPEPQRASADTGAEVLKYLRSSGSNSFVRNIVRAICELYDVPEGHITESNWKELDEEIRRRHRDESWVPRVLDRAGVRYVITDPYTDPLMDARRELGNRYFSVLRINALAVGWHRESRDHNGNSAHAFAARIGCRLDTFDDYLVLLERLVDGMAERHQVALKNALAYDREINFDDVDESLARRAWGQADPSPRERKAFGDVIVDRLCRLAGERDIPMQMHLGTAIIRGSHPLNAAGLIERHPRTRFLLMHLAYPWPRELLGLAFVYRNIWLDLTWSWLLSPTCFQSMLHEAIETLSDESRLMLGGDNWHVEETYGALTLARRLIGEVLQQKVDCGYFAASDAQRLARKIVHDNAVRFFRLE